MISGQFEVADPRRVVGWAVDADDRSAKLRVELFLHDTKLGEAIAGEWPSAPGDAAQPTGAHRFEIALGEPIDEEDQPRIRATITPLLEIDPELVERNAEIVARSGVFDPAFYGAQIGEPLAMADMIRHYLWRGERQGMRPHPLFDAAHARPLLERAGIAVGAGGTLIAYLANLESDIDPHPLFDARHYRRVSGIPLTDRTCLQQYLAAGATGACPCPLFDANYYLDANPDVMRVGAEPFLHFVTFGATEGRAPHPLFLPAYFQDELDRLGIPHPAAADLLGFYLCESESWVAGTHPLFDPAYYARVRDARGLPPIGGEPPLAAMLRLGDDLPPGPGFDVDHYRAQAAQAGVIFEGLSILNYLRDNARDRFDPHPLFSVRHYLACRPPAHRFGAEPLGEFVVNVRRGRANTRATDPIPMLADAARTLLAKSIERSGHSYRSEIDVNPPAALFEPRLYAARDRDCLAADEAPLAHYARTWGAAGIRFPPWGTALLPRRGDPSGRGPFDVVFVSHELTRTGAPAILLKIIEDLVCRRGLRGLTIAVNGGDRLEEFRTWTPVIDLSVVRAGGVPDSVFLDEMVGAFSPSSQPALVLINTACADHTATAFVTAGIPVFTLVHEIASSFPARVFENIYACSERVIYPARFVQDEAHRTHILPAGKDAIAPQGLLEPTFGAIDAGRSRRDLLDALDLPDDAFIVLNAGTLDLRKGIDVFVRVAAQVERLRARMGGCRPIHFVWLGDGDRRRHSPFSFVMEDAERLGVAGLVHFLGARANPEPFFAACDAFVLTSRLDPFPCVVHEAMACAKPVVAFAGAGGAPEALADGAGIVVDYGDIDAMAAAIRSLADDEQRCAALGTEARARVNEKYRFCDYVDRLVGLIEEGAHVDLGAPLPVPAAPRRDGRRVIFTAGQWPLSPVTASIGALIAGLNLRGFEAELVITTRDPVLGALERLPDVPTTILPEMLRSAPPLQTIWRRLGALLSGAGNAVFVPISDDVGEAVTPTLPDHVGVLAILSAEETGLAERIDRLGRFWQRAVATSTAAADLAHLRAPELADRLTLIDADIDIERVCDAYAEMLEAMFAELGSGRYRRPLPAFQHPDLGGLSLPPSLIRHPDLR